MPLYEVQHYIPLSLEERNKFAKEITRIHTREFITPSLFVNVQFTELKEGSSFIAGEEVCAIPTGATPRENMIDILNVFRKKQIESLLFSGAAQGPESSSSM